MEINSGQAFVGGNQNLSQFYSHKLTPHSVNVDWQGGTKLKLITQDLLHFAFDASLFE